MQPPSSNALSGTRTFRPTLWRKSWNVPTVFLGVRGGNDEGGVRGGGRGCGPAQRGQHGAVPRRWRFRQACTSSLMARLDRLGPAKEVAQVGAVIGREFSHALLTAVVRKAEGELVAALDRLIASGLLFRQGTPPHATYLFKHALVQDAAYGTLLREPRRTLRPYRRTP